MQMADYAAEDAKHFMRVLTSTRLSKSYQIKW